MVATAAQPSAVLLVEDEILLREIAAETMRDSGAVVYEAAEGMSALEILQRHDDIGLLLSDIKMPRMGGFELAKACLKLRPSVKILLMTGYTNEAVPPEIAQAKVPILRKPFDVDQLPELASKMTGWRLES